MEQEIRRTEFTYLSSDQRTQIRAVRYEPAGTPCGIVQLTHGMVEHMERYDAFAKYLCRNGFVVAGQDHLGHGASVTGKEKWGYFGKAEHPSDLLVEDMQLLREHLQKEYPELPYMMLGHSMGSYMLRKYLSVHGEGVAKAVVMGTGDVSRVQAGLGLFLIRVLSAIHGEEYRSKMIQQMTYSKSYRKFDLTGEHPENSWLTKDTGIVKAYYADPRCTFLFTLNAYKGLVEAAAYDAKPENIRKIPSGIRILLASGADDPVGDLSAGVKRTYEKFKAAGLNVQMKLYPGDRHEILNETDRGQVWKDMLTFFRS